MKIVFFSLNRLAFTGGAEKYILEVSRVFKKKGHEVYYLGDCRPLLLPNVLAGLITGVKNLRGVWQEFKDLWLAPSFPAEALSFLTPQRLALSSFFPLTPSRKKTRDQLKNSDLIFVKNEILDVLAFWWLSLFLGKSKTVLLAFSSFNYPSKTRRGYLHNLVYLSPFYVWLVRSFSFVVVSNQADVTLLETKFGLPNNTISLIHYGLNPDDIAIYQPPFPPDQVLRKTMVLFVGRLEEQKGIDILIDVIRRINRSEISNKVEFTIIGDGPERERIERFAKEEKNLNYLGEIPRSEVIKNYFRHDLLLVPSRWETFSYVTLEAQFCGLPVVAFNIPGPQDIIEDGITGRLVKPGDLDGLVGAVEDYVCHGISRDEREQIRQRVQEKFSIEKTAAALLISLRV